MVTVINTNTYALTTISVESPTRGVAVGPDGTHVYVTNYYTGKVSVIAVATNNVETVSSVGSLPNAVAFSPDGSLAYVTNNGSGTVSVVSIVPTGP